MKKPKKIQNNIQMTIDSLLSGTIGSEAMPYQCLERDALAQIRMDRSMRDKTIQEVRDMLITGFRLGNRWWQYEMEEV